MPLFFQTDLIFDKYTLSLEVIKVNLENTNVIRGSLTKYIKSNLDSIVKAYKFYSELSVMI